MSGHWAEGRRPLAMRSQDARGPAYTAAVEQSEAAFAAVRGVLGDGVLVDTAGELADLAGALPPETPVLLADWPRIAAGEQAEDGWVEAVGATLAMVAGPPVTPVRDQAGREHDVISPALQLGVFVLPGPHNDGMDDHIAWRKASKSFSNGNCVEIAALPGGAVGVRDSKDREGPVLRFTAAEWDAFIGGAKAGEFDRLM